MASNADQNTENLPIITIKMNDDSTASLQDVRAASSQPLSTRILDVRRRAGLVAQKTAMRLCVQVDMEEDSSGQQPIDLRHHYSDEYIAISCPWSLPGYDTVSGRYRFAPEQPPGVIMPPDVVLDRILNFKRCNPEYLRTPFWIDKVCINQDGASDEKEMAVHSMDLVYQYSGRVVPVEGGTSKTVGCSLGILFVRMDTVRELTVLRKVLDSKYAESNDDEPKLLVPVEEALEALDLIEMILGDNWWHRAWIFQEEFLASRHMILLLPSSVDRSDGSFIGEEGVDLYGKTTGEIHVHALNFRSEVTNFCLALGQNADETVRRRCDEILKHARRYTFLYRSRVSLGPSSVVRAMSPAIFEDISTRGITVPSDILAIAANCCRYVARLNSKVLDDTQESLSIAILTMFVMNGEIVRHDVAKEDVLRHTVFECLRIAKLHIEPPILAGALIFIKACRLPPVKMTTAGLEVKGVLARLDKRVTTPIPEPLRQHYLDTVDANNMRSLHDAEKSLLQTLARHLETLRRQGGDALHGLLRDYAESRSANGEAQYWQMLHMQLMMAKAVCRRLAEGKPLWMARVHSPGTWTPWLGVFVPDDDAAFAPGVSFVFTATETDHEFKDRGAKLARKNTRVASLEVSFASAGRQIVPKRWLNGLWFFNAYHQRDLVIPWPRWMQ